MSKRSQIAVLSTAQSSLTGFLFGSLDFNSFPAGVATAGRTSVMGQLGAIALRASDQGRRSYFDMITPFTLTGFGSFSLW